MTHICVSKLTIIGSDNGLAPGRRQAIIWTNDGILLIRTFWTHFSEIVSEIHTFSFKKIHLKMSSGKCRPFCLGLNVLMQRFSTVYSYRFKTVVIMWFYMMTSVWCNFETMRLVYVIRKLLVNWVGGFTAISLRFLSLSISYEIWIPFVIYCILLELSK